MAASANLLHPNDPLDRVAQPFLWPGRDGAYPLGTDMLGRDIASGVFHRERVSLLLGAVAPMVSLAIGVTVGALSGYCGGWLDAVAMRITELFQTIPPFLCALAIVAIPQPSIPTITVAIGHHRVALLASLVRAEVLKRRHGELVAASIALGASDLRHPDGIPPRLPRPRRPQGGALGRHGVAARCCAPTGPWRRCRALPSWPPCWRCPSSATG